MSFTLRPYQAEGIAAIRDALNDPDAQPLYVLPTGGGKTVCFSYIATRAAARGNRVGILMHRQELINQTSRALGAHPHGIVRGGARPRPNLMLQVCSVQTLVNRLDQYDFDIIIVDEAHHCTAASYRKTLAAYPRARVIGVTATPCRTDGTGLASAGYNKLIMGPTTAELTTAGYLAPAEVYAPGGIDVSGVGISRGDYKRKALAVAADKPSITGCAVTHYRKICSGSPAIAFCVSVEHAEHVAESFKRAGFSAASIDGKMTDRERRRLISALADGSLQVLCSCDLISEGVDVPVVAAGIMLRPTQSRALWIQQMGRCLRPAPGKTHAVILDHAGNTAKFGLPTTPQEWSLDGDRKAGKRSTSEEPPVRICGECFRPHVSAPVCPRCGYVYPARPRELTEIAGELQKIEIKAEARAARMEVGRASSLEELQEIAEQRGYKPGWAWHRWQAKQRKRVSA